MSSGPPEKRLRKIAFYFKTKDDDPDCQQKTDDLSHKDTDTVVKSVGLIVTPATSTAPKTVVHQLVRYNIWKQNWIT